VRVLLGIALCALLATTPAAADVASLLHPESPLGPVLESHAGAGVRSFGPTHSPVGSGFGGFGGGSPSINYSQPCPVGLTFNGPSSLPCMFVPTVPGPVVPPPGLLIAPIKSTEPEVEPQAPRDEVDGGRDAAADEATAVAPPQDAMSARGAGDATPAPLPPPRPTGLAAALALAGPALPVAGWLAALLLAGGALVAILLARRRAGLPLLPLGQKNGRARATVRDAVLEAVRANPGIHKQGLVRHLGRSNGTIEHHLDRLVAAGEVVLVRRNGYNCHFAAAGVDRRIMGAAAVLKSETARSLLQAVAATPGLGLTVAARALGASVSTIHYHLGRLAEAGLVQVHAAGSARHVHPTPLAHQALATWAGAAPASDAGSQAPSLATT
jgi:DNA-binding MarR family transcriptional regulator